MVELNLFNPSQYYTLVSRSPSNAFPIEVFQEGDCEFSADIEQRLEIWNRKGFLLYFELSNPLFQLLPGAFVKEVVI